ncbi:hypothetical protein LptCag_2359 [Leptospirillum ferriphilum]|uniref:Uncharacterized protein n=1 Tax=Leptospirillum ferriphilum TaxID=178606 RepID=A0A094WEG0_9BACT|nr:hypothetical protein LptCag_2359 [Leptospirillum ferriphilum]
MSFRQISPAMLVSGGCSSSGISLRSILILSVFRFRGAIIADQPGEDRNGFLPGKGRGRAGRVLSGLSLDRSGTRKKKSQFRMAMRP